MNHHILKNLLSHSFYEQNKTRLKRALFEDEAADLYDILTAAHEKYGCDLTSKELMSLYTVQHPVATRAERGIIEDLIRTIEATDPLSNAVAKDVIENMWRQEIGREIANIGININEGDYQAMDTLKALLEKVETGFLPDDLPEPCRMDIDELMQEATDENRWEFNIKTLSRHVYGIGPTEFMVVFAMSNAGKSAFGVSLACAPGGFCEQGARVLYIGNEEKVSRTRLRAMTAWSGSSAKMIAQTPGLNVEVRRKWQELEDQIDFIDTQDWDLTQIEAYIAKSKPDVVIVDQADKVQIGGSYNASHERLRELYRRLREVAKRHDCALIAVSQASAEAEGRTRLSYTMMEGSKIGKAAESDLIIGIGKHSGDTEDNEPDNTRFLTVSKNKLSGWHGTIICNIQPEISRYVE